MRLLGAEPGRLGRGGRLWRGGSVGEAGGDRGLGLALWRRRLLDLGERLFDALAHFLDADPHQRRHVVVALLALREQAKHCLLVVRQPHRRKAYASRPPERRG